MSPGLLLLLACLGGGTPDTSPPADDSGVSSTSTSTTPGTSTTDTGCVPVEETCNGADDDCDGVVDELPRGATGYVDLDRDGYGDARADACTPPEDVDAENGDCDDANPDVNPGEDEICDPDDVDENCDRTADSPDTEGCVPRYVDADGDGWGIGTQECICEGYRNYRAEVAGDCDDGDPSITTECEGAISDAAAAIFGDGEENSAQDPYYMEARWASTTLGGETSGGWLVLATSDGTTVVPVPAEGAVGVVATRTALVATAMSLVTIGDGTGDGTDDLVAASAECKDGEDTSHTGCEWTGYLVPGPVEGEITAGEATVEMELLCRDLILPKMATPGDIDGDGSSDVLVACVEGYDTGVVKLEQGAGTVVLSGDYYAGLERVGDATGDGLDDLLVLGMDAADGPEGAYLFAGPIASPSSLADADAYLAVGLGALDTHHLVADVTGDAYPDLLYVVNGSSAEVFAGPLVTGVGSVGGVEVEEEGSNHDLVVVGGPDVDGDGVGDLVAGDHGARDGLGAMYVVTGPISGTTLLPEAWLRIYGEEVEWSFGSTVLEAHSESGLMLAVSDAESDRYVEGGGAIHLFGVFP